MEPEEKQIMRQTGNECKNHNWLPDGMKAEKRATGAGTCGSKLDE